MVMVGVNNSSQQKCSK